MVIPPLWSTPALGLVTQAAAARTAHRRETGRRGNPTDGALPRAALALQRRETGETPTGGTAPTGLALTRFPFPAASSGGLPGWMGLQMPKVPLTFPS